MDDEFEFNDMSESESESPGSKFYRKSPTNCEQAKTQKRVFSPEDAELRKIRKRQK